MKVPQQLVPGNPKLFFTSIVEKDCTHQQFSTHNFLVSFDETFRHNKVEQISANHFRGTAGSMGKAAALAGVAAMPYNATVGLWAKASEESIARTVMGSLVNSVMARQRARGRSACYTPDFCTLSVRLPFPAIAAPPFIHFLWGVRDTRKPQPLGMMWWPCLAIRGWVCIERASCSA